MPSLLALSGKGYGLDKGIPTLVIAAASIDDVLAITGFGVLLSIAFSSGMFYDDNNYNHYYNLYNENKANNNKGDDHNKYMIIIIIIII